MTDQPHGPDWRSVPTDADGRRVRPGWLIAAAAVLAAGVLALVWFIQPPRTASVLVVTISGASADAPVPFSEADAEAFAPLQFAVRPLPSDPTRDQLRAALADLKSAPSGRPLVVVLNGLVEVSDGGELFLTRATLADHERNRVPLTELLAAVRAAPAPHKLVVLNCSAAGEWVRAAVAAANAVPDDKRLILFAHGAGEEGYASDVRGRSVFAHYYSAGVNGAADGYGGGAKDGCISTDELAAFVRARVGRWAERCRTRPQTPWLLGTAADFPVGVTTAVEQPEPVEWQYPEAFREAWAVRDEWLADGRADAAPAEFDQLERALLRMDRRWQAGKAAGQLRAEFDTAAALWARSAEVRAFQPPEVLKSVPTPDAAAVQALTRFLLRTEGVTPPSPEKPPPATADVILAAASGDPPPTLPRLVRLAKLLAEVEPEAGGVPSLLLRRLAITDDPVSAERFARLLAAAIRFEAVARRAELFAWAGGVVDAANKDFTTAVACVFHPAYTAAADAETALAAFEEAVRVLGVADDSLRAATAELRRSERALAAGTAVNPARLEAATAVLRTALAPPTESPAAKALGEAASAWANAQGEVEAVRKAVAPDPAEWQRVRRNAESPAAGPKELEAVERVLATAGASAADRAALWKSRLTLSARLQAEVWRLDARDDESAAAGFFPEQADPREQPRARFDRITPVGRGVGPANPDTAPARTAILRWHAERFAYFALNPADLPNPAAEVRFATRAAEQCRRAVSDAPVRPSLEFDLPASPVVLTAETRTRPVPVQVRLVGGAKGEPARVGVFTPSPEWVSPTAAASVNLSPVAAVAVNQSLKLGTAPEAVPLAKGVLVRGEAAGRVFFRRVSVDTSSVSNRLRLLATAGGVEEEAKELRVRPNGTPQAVGLVLANPSAAPQTVNVRLDDPPRETAKLVIPARDKLPLVFLPPPPAPPPAVAPTAPVAQPPEFTPLPERLRVEVLDATTREVRQMFVVVVRTAEPAEWLNVREVKVQGGELTATVAERETLRGGAMPLSLAFPADRNPGLAVPDGKLGGALEPGGAAVTLYAKNLKRQPGTPLVATLSADGVERAFSFTGEPSDGGAVRLQPFTAPRVKVRVKEFASPFDPLPVRCESDNAPPGATLEVKVGTGEGDAFRADFTHLPVPAKARTVGVKFDPKGLLLLKASVSDPEPKLAVDELVGRRVVRVRLLDANGKELARDTAAVTFDNDAPRNVRFVGLPAKAAIGQPLAVKAAAEVPVSGWKEVRFFVGKPADGKPPANAAFVPGKPTDTTEREWAASLPLGDGKTPVEVSVEFVSKAGRSGFDTRTVERADAAELNKPEPGKISGQVLEGDLKQPGLAVQLLLGGKEKAKATTDDDGKFAFPDLPPGKYELSVEKGTTRRVRKDAVEVKAGEEVVKVLKLVLK